jgi:transglutaminase/protease-like cytokinesis protein 3
MLRSVGVPSKLVEGQSTYTSVYHAWNQIYVDEKWVTVDTTVDAQLAPRGIAYSIEKLDKDYSVVKAF